MWACVGAPLRPEYSNAYASSVPLFSSVPVNVPVAALDTAGISLVDSRLARNCDGPPCASRITDASTDAPTTRAFRYIDGYPQSDASIGGPLTGGKGIRYLIF